MGGMRVAKGRRVAIFTAIVGFAAIADTAFINKRSILERFWLWRYESKNTEEKLHALTALKKMHSRRAIEIDLKTIVLSAEIFQISTGQHPGIEDVVFDENNFPGTVVDSSQIKDPWGRLYSLKFIDDKPHAFCYGKDGVPGGDGEDRDYEFPGSLKP